jgi:hypothetical protein
MTVHTAAKGFLRIIDVEEVQVANANNLIKLAHGLAVTAGRADGITCRNNMTGVQANPRFPTLGSVVN